MSRRVPEAETSRKKDLKNLDDLLELQEALGSVGEGASDGEHPFDLSQVHSQIADYPDYSDEDQPQGKK